MKALIVTRGGEGSEIHTGGRTPSTFPDGQADDRGPGPDRLRRCLPGGSAVRYRQRIRLADQTGRLASLMGAIKIAQPRRAEPSPPAVTTSPRPLSTQPSAPCTLVKREKPCESLQSDHRPVLPPSPSPAVPPASLGGGVYYQRDRGPPGEISVRMGVVESRAPRSSSKAPSRRWARLGGAVRSAASPAAPSASGKGAAIAGAVIGAVAGGLAGSGRSKRASPRKQARRGHR